MKQIILNRIENKKIYCTQIKWNNAVYFTGFYYDMDGNDFLFNNGENIIGFKSVEELRIFCDENNLELSTDISEFDFDKILDNPINYKEALNKWNLLNTISINLNIAFEGNEYKYNETYNYLFSCNFAVEPLPELYNIPNIYYREIQQVYKNQCKLLDKIIYSIKPE